MLVHQKLTHPCPPVDGVLTVSEVESRGVVRLRPEGSDVLVRCRIHSDDVSRLKVGARVRVVDGELRVEPEYKPKPVRKPKKRAKRGE